MKIRKTLKWYDYESEKPENIYGEYFHGEFLVYFKECDGNNCFYDTYATDFEEWKEIEKREDIKILKYALLQKFKL